MDWAEKYRPKHLADLVGNKDSIRQMIEWAQKWTVKSDPLLVYGKPGIGKTSSAYALAVDMGWEVIELNASDQRTKAIIERVIGSSASTGSLTGSGRKLIILDEADNLQGNSDRGGARAIVEVIKKASHPIIIIANDLYGLDPAIRSLCEKVLFKASQARSIAPRLKEICINEGVSCDVSAITDISERSSGDIRAAVTMLYAVTIGKSQLTEEGLATSKKDTRSTIFDLVAATIFKKSPRSLLDLSYEVDETPDTIIQWIESNITLLKDQTAISSAYQALSRSDEYLGRTFKTQYYTLWRYATALMLLGVQSSVGSFGGYAKIMPPNRWKRMSSGKHQKTSREQLLDKLGSAMHMASYTIRSGYLPSISLLAEIDPLRYAEEFSLDADQLDLLIQDSDLSQKIIKQMNEKRKTAERESKVRQKAEKGTAKRGKKCTSGSERNSSSPTSSQLKTENGSDESAIIGNTTDSREPDPQIPSSPSEIPQNGSGEQTEKKSEKKGDPSKKQSGQSSLLNFGG